MAWIELHQSLIRHPKLSRLARELHIGRPQAIGHLCCLWLWTLDYAPDGRLSAFTSTEAAVGAEWTGKPEEFLQALKSAGWIDEDGNIHDWEKYGGKLLKKREADKNRKREAKNLLPDESIHTYEEDSFPSEFQRNSNGKREDSEVDKIRIDKKTLDKKKEKDSRSPEFADWAENLYSAYPRKVGKASAIRAISNALKRNELTYEQMLEKVNAFAASPAGNAGNYTPHPATWFNAARYLDDPAEWDRRERGNGQLELLQADPSLDSVTSFE